MMTVEDVREHAERLQGRLDLERRRVGSGGYTGHPAANLELISALEHRVAALLEQCDLLELWSTERGVQVTTLDLEALVS